VGFNECNLTIFISTEGEKMDTKKLGRWLYLGGMLVTVVIAVFELADNLGADAGKWVTWILMLAAILAGIWYADHDDAAMIGLRYLALVAVVGVFAVTETTPAGFLVFGDFDIGNYLTLIAGGVVKFVGPYVLTVLFMRFFKKEFS